MADTSMNIPSDPIPTPHADRAQWLAQKCGSRACMPSDWNALTLQLDRLRTIEEQHAQVRAAVLAYYEALDRRQHGGIAHDKAMRTIEQALGLSWQRGATLPERVLDVSSPPIGVCSSCGRKTWAIDELGDWCDMPQPTGGRCVGVMRGRP